MAKEILVLDADKRSCRQLCALLRGWDYAGKPIHALQDLERSLQEGDFMAVIMDLDSMAVDNRIVRHLTIRYPGVCFLATSRDRFHPDLKDAIGDHIYACLKKPIDEEELSYWLKTIAQEERDTKGQGDTWRNRTQSRRKDETANFEKG